MQNHKIFQSLSQTWLVKILIDYYQHKQQRREDDQPVHGNSPGTQAIKSIIIYWPEPMFLSERCMPLFQRDLMTQVCLLYLFHCCETLFMI